MIAENRRARAHIDIPLILLVSAMSIFGVLAVCVATFSPSSTAETWLAHIVESSYAMRQCFFLLLAPVIVTVILNIPFHVIRRFTKLLYFAASGLVLFTLVTNGAEGVKAWTDVIWGMTIQPSEFIKLAMILMLAQELSKDEHPMGTLKEFMRIMMLIAVPGVIILASGETGSLIVIVFFAAVMMFFSGVNMKLLLTLAAIVVLIPYVLSTSGVTLSSMNGSGWICLLIVGLIHTGVTYCLYFSALRELPGQEAAILSYMDPLVAIVISVTILGEHITLLQLIGGLLILGFTIWNEITPKPRVITESKN